MKGATHNLAPHNGQLRERSECHPQVRFASPYIPEFNHVDGDFVRRKLVIIGDGACGKTSLLSVFTLGYFPTVSPRLPIHRLQFQIHQLTSSAALRKSTICASLPLTAIRRSDHAIPTNAPSHPTRLLTVKVYTDSHRFRKLRHRLQSRWQVSTAGAVGYSRTGGLRAAAPPGIFQSTCHSDRIFRRHSRLAGQCQT